MSLTDVDLAVLVAQRVTGGEILPEDAEAELAALRDGADTAIPGVGRWPRPSDPWDIALADTARMKDRAWWTLPAVQRHDIYLSRFLEAYEGPLSVLPVLVDVYCGAKACRRLVARVHETDLGAMLVVDQRTVPKARVDQQGYTFSHVFLSQQRCDLLDFVPRWDSTVHPRVWVKCREHPAVTVEVDRLREPLMAATATGTVQSIRLVDDSVR